METTMHAAVAKLIRSDLKAAFPGFIFRVTSSATTTSSSVYVRWGVGPSVSEVQDLLAPHRACPGSWPRPTVEYIQCSSNARALVAAAHEAAAEMATW